MLKRIAAAWLVSLVMLPSLSMAGLTVGSFNVLHLGWSNDKRYDQLAAVASQFDLVAFQEVMSVEGLEMLIKHMERSSGEDWRYIASHAVGRGTYQEMYAMAWRDSVVEYAGGAVVYLDSRDVFSREPLLAAFRSKATGQELALANIHILYGDSMQDREPEIHALTGIWDWMAEVYPGMPRMIAGDFNAEPSEPAWAALRRRGAVPAIQQGASTLSSHDGKYANLYDNLWYEADALDISDRGILRFPQLLGITHEVARDTVSDHAPVYVGLNGVTLALVPAQATRITSTQVAANDPVYECVDLNRSPKEVLERLPHIGEARASDIEAGRPWVSVDALDSIRGIGPSRLADIVNSGLLCGS
ncbi:endonuclease/exonuclease/phosphatase family protein [Halomonas sp. McH1-25]|uniref:endonuclease/exonuclease/phosphatase family protein n=1 Tax=unclassified Halomonas TaxID=2609666 RepID=UPI001EF62DD2|nr:MULTISPECIES: endonuclease/exonuclease/phosphatase family protein [unclassified Halomonas]MCG7602044.1 endonuclease/exonuclease/phosphatase family protein [Halomonas sp. McH1-25]MCP1342880.1 endonuclease/exonuclease/phosphatase family protein [Halomonas sp. FL8]MCP1361681.1 endonuclease/exonuclease/phosphatase family protein [Halomonas sp. BBD45]MCP1363622.1 endonuclease/exonuclease/phosphatase family protein [Halomonas sp. BBD48]